MNLLKLPENEKKDFDFEEEDDYPEEEAVLEDLRARSRRMRPEALMGIVAAVAAALLIAVLVLSLPYMFRDEDPETAKAQYIRQTEPEEEVILEPTISETEPENPTIPPDRNPYGRYDFQYNRHNYLLLQNVDSSPGVDVSAHQGDIDWAAVKKSGIEFAIIRLGYRGYGSGKLVEDEYAKKNLQAAKEAGLKIGAYFFSQALDIKETDEEIQFMLNMLADVDLDMPLVLDWEIPAEDARTKNMDARTLTDIQLHFCGQMKKMGYQPMVYFNWHQSENLYYLSELEDYPFWLALYQDRMTYPWKVEMWQWTSSGKVPGIQGNVDINVFMPH
ncbi:MAG: glycoside hydrolase family 25 protein [Candidatus Faecousia sp.]|nr:glycoside hydrolase family 25 protein [Clostridiales bacterium]MCI6935885.1 glycoside hydrolase family 25 protein [Clostridiales bacterium]MDD5883812.1 glycoside hydrolase family 25 protein [Bacillota bacterium]MDY4598739.1 glycoside hydrolase family 25 protein [Candidatus Faecousia sp.]